MIETTLKMYECSVCGNKSSNKLNIKKCESKAITHDKGVKIGDIVLITRGQSKGKKAKVTKIFIYDIDWGHYAWKRYWHTVGLEADIINHYATNQLTFDSYEV